jgi:hypothetical protein
MQEFMMKFNEAAKNLIFPKCNTFERVGVGIVLSGLSYKAGQLFAQNADLLTGIGAVNKDGQVDLDLLEHAVGDGIIWPLKVGAFKFSKDDLTEIMQKVRAM